MIVTSELNNKHDTVTADIQCIGSESSGARDHKAGVTRVAALRYWYHLLPSGSLDRRVQSVCGGVYAAATRTLTPAGAGIQSAEIDCP